MTSPGSAGRPLPQPQVIKAALGLAAAGLAYARLEAVAYRVRRVEVPVLPAGARPLTVLHISDLHLWPRQRRIQSWLPRLAELEPDFVINTGDNLAHPEAVPAALHAMEPLLDLPGAFVLGSNDYYAPRPKNPARYLDAGRRAPHPWGGTPVASPARCLRGQWLDRSHERGGRRDASAVGGSACAAWTTHTWTLIATPTSPAGRPARRPHDRDSRTHPSRACSTPWPPTVSDLVLAGHTHGGQLCVPGYGALVTNCGLPRAQASGLSRWADSWLHVSAGLGTSPYTPVRFACPPSATLLTLVARPGAPASVDEASRTVRLDSAVAAGCGAAW